MALSSATIPMLCRASSVLADDRATEISRLDRELAQGVARDRIEFERRHQQVLGTRLLDTVVACESFGSGQQRIHRGEIGAGAPQLAEHLDSSAVTWRDARHVGRTSCGRPAS